MNTQSYSPTIKVNLPEGMLQNARAEAGRIGISLQDFIRMLMATYFANAHAVQAVSHDQAFFKQAKREIKAGQFTPITTPEQLTSYLDGLEA